MGLVFQLCGVHGLFVADDIFVKNKEERKKGFQLELEMDQINESVTLCHFDSAFFRVCQLTNAALTSAYTNWSECWPIGSLFMVIPTNVTQKTLTVHLWTHRIMLSLVHMGLVQ